MPEYIKAFRKSQVDEFRIYMEQVAKIKHTKEGYSVTYEIANYGFEYSRTTMPNSQYEDVRLHPEPEPVKDVLPEHTITVDTPAVPPPRGRGRAPVPRATVNRAPNALPELGYCTTHTYRNMDYNRHMPEFDRNETAIFYTNYKIPRLLMLKDFASRETFYEKMYELLFSSSGQARRGPTNDRRMAAIRKVKQYHFYSVRIEGVHFNKVEDTSKLPFKIHMMGKKPIYEFKDDFFFSESLVDNGEIKRWLKSKPIDEVRFLEGLKTHFLTRMSETVKAKEEQARKLETALINLQKEVGEIRFVEKSVRSSTDSHFTGVIQKIRNLPTVKSLTFTALGFTVETKDLYVEPEEDNKFYVGRYEIVIEVTDSFRAEFRNLEAPEIGSDRYKSYSQHPHGSCQGSHYYVMMQAIKSLDYFTFILASIERLQTVNRFEQDGNYLESQNYPRVKPKKADLKKFEEFMSLIDDSKLKSENEVTRPQDDEDADADADDDDDDDDDDDYDDEEG